MKLLTKWAERTLWAAGAVALAYVGWTYGVGAYEQSRGNELFLQQAAVGGSGQPNLMEGSLVGRLEIPRLGVSTIVFEGTSDATLDKGVGHLSGSAFPELGGNVVLAAHRDTFFRPLKDIRVGDVITLRTPRAEVRYVVRETQLVEPNEVEVVKPTKEAVLTLLTCYPFSYLGSAPDRFVVRAMVD
ncbi:MAG: class D sortase [Acidobacteriota bacterium]